MVHNLDVEQKDVIFVADMVVVKSPICLVVRSKSNKILHLLFGFGWYCS